MFFRVLLMQVYTRENGHQKKCAMVAHFYATIAQMYAIIAHIFASVNGKVQFYLR